MHSMPSTVQNVGSMKPGSGRRPKLDQIGEWSELKLDILKKYAGAYCTILKARGLRPIYIDGFAGAGVHIRKGTKELVPGSPLNALEVEPPFEEQHWIDLDESKVAALKSHTAGLKHVHIYGGDANRILVNEVFPKIRFDHFERALCILDPYGLHTISTTDSVLPGMGSGESELIRGCGTVPGQLLKLTIALQVDQPDNSRVRTAMKQYEPRGKVCRD